MEIYRALKTFSAFNEDGEPHASWQGESVLLLDNMRFEWVFFYAGGTRFSLQKDQFERFTERLV